MSILDELDDDSDMDDILDVFEKVDFTELNQEYITSKKCVDMIAKFFSTEREISKEKDRIKKIDKIVKKIIDLLNNNIYLTNQKNRISILENIVTKLYQDYQCGELSDKVTIGIGGKFSAGKSKFINSILNIDTSFLPEDQNPTTSLPTYITYGSSENMIAQTVDNNKIKIDKEMLQSFTHKFIDKLPIELNNVSALSFSSFIKNIVVEHPNFPYKDIVLIDTPGYNKPKTEKDDRLDDEIKARNILSTAENVIWLIDVENGMIGETDIDFIENINIQNPILVILTKADKKRDEHIKLELESIEECMCDKGIDVFAVTAYSSRDKIEWGNNDYIHKFFYNAQNKKKNTNKILSEINKIQQSILYDIDELIEKKETERNELNEIIFSSDDIMNLNGIIIVYGEIMVEIREIKKIKKEIKKYWIRLNKLVEEYLSEKH